MFSRKFSVSIHPTCYKSFLHTLLVDFSYSYRQPMLYSHFCASTTQSGCLALPTVAITATAIVYWLILHWSVYYPDHRIRNFTIHTNQHNNLRLSVSLSIIKSHDSTIRPTNKYPCFAHRPIRCFSAGYNPSALS